MTEIQIEAFGFEEAERGMVRMIAMLSDLRPFWPLLVPLFVEWMGEQFESEGRWGRDPWAPLTEDYAARKSLLYPGRGILYATGDLRRSASNPKRRATPTSLALIVDDSDKRHGGRVPRSVAGFHQEGGPNLPRRPIIPDEIPASAQAQVREVAEEWVAEMVARLGAA